MEQATAKGMGTFLDQIKTVKLVDKYGDTIDITKKAVTDLSKDLQAQLEAVNPTQFAEFLTMQKQVVMASMSTSYTIMFSFCAVAYLIAWSIMKMLVPKEKQVRL
jgi:ACS family hexuronate transporter-like MFS transporter